MVCIFAMTPINVSVDANTNNFREENIQMSSSDIKLQGTLIIPNGPGPHPAIILIHGAGEHTREDYRDVAEIFVKHGVAAFIYDKRTIGYSADGVGEKSRSYALLAEDVINVVDALSLREELDSKMIGLWGLSEGSSVAPLAAVQFDKIAFLILVSPSGVPPAQQTSWEKENAFRQYGITADSFIHSISRSGTRLLVSAGMFAEATYNHVPPLEELQQPVLVIWGSNDRTAPPAESFHIMQNVLKRSGNEHYTFQFIPEANHDLRFSEDGFVNSEQFARGYSDAMTSWLKHVINGKNPRKNVIGEIPKQHHISYSRAIEPSWYDSVWLHLGILVIVVMLFASYYGTALLRLIRKQKADSVNLRAIRLTARLLAIAGIVSTLGFFGYFGYIMFTNHPGPIILGRPIAWLIIQLTSIATCVLTILLTFLLQRAGSIISGGERGRIVILIISGIIFIPWALYWRLLIP